MCSGFFFLAAEFKCGGGSYKADVLGLKRAIRGQAVVTASGLVQKTDWKPVALFFPVLAALWSTPAASAQSSI